MKSDFCERFFDTVYSYYQFAWTDEAWEELLNEIEPALKKYDGGKIFLSDMAGWFGFTYRQLYIETGICSSDLVDIVPINDLAALYPAYHALSEDMCAERIIESYSLPVR